MRIMSTNGSRRWRQIIAAFAAGMLLISAAPWSVMAEETDGAGNAASSSATGTTEDAAADAPDYFSYTQAHGEQPRAKTPVTLAAGAGTLSESGAERRTEYEGEADVAVLQNGGWIEWAFTVSESALYTLDLRYIALPGAGRDLKAGFTLDGEVPFLGASELVLNRVWKDEGEMKQDKQGNDLVPEQVEVFEYRDLLLTDNSGFLSGAFEVYLEAGEHTIRLTNNDDAMGVASLTLAGKEEFPTYAEVKAEYDAQGYRPVGGAYIEQQAEQTEKKSSQILYPVYDHTEAATVPNDPAKIRRNVIGQSNWSDSGMWVTYQVEAPEDGLYLLSIKYRQNSQLGMSTYRNIYVNGEIPFQEFENVSFPFNFNWQNLTVSDAEGNPCYVYLKKGTNEIRMEATVGKWTDILQEVNALNAEMNTLYRRIIVVTSTSPDTYRDYQLDVEIDGLVETLQRLSDSLSSLADTFDKVNGEKSTQSETLRRVAEQLRSFAEDTDEIPSRLGNFRDNIGTISTWLLNNVKQPLEIDYFVFRSAEQELPAARAGFFQGIWFGIRQFLATFSSDYNSMDDWEADEAITVWSTDGRDQVQVLKDMITNEFTPQTGILVNLNVVQTGFIEATLSGLAPDVGIGMARGQPVNLASRGALVDLSRFDTFDEVMARFSKDAAVPYQYDGATYALPVTQLFFMMFYRTDIFEELDLDVPQTWDEVDDVVAVLQRKNMTMGLPYTTITAQTAVDTGVGAKDLFSLLLLQYGGTYYNEDQTATALDSRAALDAFKRWTGYYTESGFDLTYDFNTRFRTGEMPLAIQSVGMYSTLQAAAPEIRGQWAMVPVPGIEQEDGSIDRSVGASGTAGVIFEKAENKEACWKFLDWYTSTETQKEFGTRVENLLGPAARYQTANLEAFNNLPWSDAELENLEFQRGFVQEIQEVPGSYFVSRCLDNAFRDVLYSSKNPRTALESENENINRELERKRIELRSRKTRG